VKALKDHPNDKNIFLKGRREMFRFKRLKILAFIFICLLLSEPNLKAEIVQFSLQEMVSASQLVVVGEVVDIKKRKHVSEQLGQGYLAKVRIKEILKKEKTESVEPEIGLSFYPESGISEDPEFIIKENVILFLRKHKKTYGLVQGFAGRVQIWDGLVRVQGIYDEPGGESVDVFLQKIRDTKSWHDGYR